MDLHRLLKIITLNAILLLSGCAGLGQLPARELPVQTTPEQWQAAVETVDGSPQRWLLLLDDPLLEQLVATALVANPELQRVRAVLAEGRAQAIVAGAEQQSTLSASADAGRSGLGSQSANSLSLGLSVGWELDLWDKLSDSARAAEIDRQALLEDYRSARLSLAANITKGWFAAIEASQQLGLSQHLLEVLSARLAVLEEGYSSGLVAALDVHLARANRAAESSRLATREQTLGTRVRALELLLGHYPANRQPLADRLPALPGPIPAGLPSELLTRRYDVGAAQLRVESAWARLSRSHKDRFPRFNLTASLGSRSEQLDRLLRGDTLIWSLLGGVAQPLLDGGRLKAQEAKALAQAQQREASYKDTVLRAFAEVEEALQQERQLLRSVTALEVSVLESELAEQLAAEQYRSGLVEYITLLEAQRRAFDARSTLIEGRNQQLQNRIDLYLALGGDFRLDAALDPAPAPVNRPASIPPTQSPQ
ncbi:MAG: multidrug efflux system outer membrane protein [Motiliproteus sp.]|jgi:multidrug efflux system outer membrane protein